MYFEDLTPYVYARTPPDPTVVNVGWLSVDRPHPRGPVPPDCVRILRQLAARPVNVYRGLHVCELCRSTRAPVATGTGEIRICGRDGVTYVAPTLVVHYIEAHQYQPPASFVTAILEQT